ncbi:MAG: TIGR00730 family Rossman fold protein [Christensenella sp.]|nr:TIGR00730 family Rossman fold protein [Christensenella sp.]
MEKICVFGSSSSVLDPVYVDAAYLLGQLIARKGWELVFGAGDMGLMGSVARGVHSEKGQVTGVIPEFMDRPGIPYKDCDQYIVLPTMRERKARMEELSDAFIAAPGGFGTFEELCEVITLKQLRRHTKPVIILNTNHFYDELIAMFEKTITEKFAKKEGLSVYTVVSSPQEAILALEDYRYVDTGEKWFTPDSR